LTIGYLGDIFFSGTLRAGGLIYFEAVLRVVVGLERFGFAYNAPFLAVMELF
jgi:hypothetical protein